ncbi:MAG: hypothetical protein OXI20_05430 [Rhodospirillales bacterium]|nr:hypothetical protein [Rhodospirillales bacterium]
MRWPWQKQEEVRQSDGAYADAVLRAIEAEAAGTAADNAATGAVEAAAGALSRAFASAMVEGPAWAAEAVTGDFLALAGRDLIRRGESLHAIRMSGGMAKLIPCASWHWEGGHDPASWTVRATAYGPSSSTTWKLPASSVVFVRWGGDAGSPYLGKGPLRFAATTAKLGAMTQRSLADEAGGPVAQLLALPEDPAGTDEEGQDDPHARLKADIVSARGRAAFVASTADAWGEGRDAAPRRDWQAARLGPDPPAALVEASRDAFAATLAACGASVALFDDADGTAKREALRQWHMTCVRPLAGLVERELSRKLGADVRLKFDPYALDMVSRSQVVERLTRAGVALNVAMDAVGVES